MRFDFEWDARKAASAFLDPLARLIVDPRHSIGELRLVLFGHSSTGRLLAVMFTERSRNHVRIFSARPATRRERRDYEEENG